MESGKLQKLKAKMAEISSQIDEADERKASAKAATIQAQQRLEKAEAENISIQKRITLLEKELEDVNRRQEAIAEKLPEQGDEKMQQLKEEVKEARTVMEEIGARLTEAGQKRVELTRDIERTTEKYEVYEGRAQMLEETLKNGQGKGEFSVEIVRMQEEIKLLEAKLREKQGGIWLQRDSSWVVDSTGTPWVDNGVTYDAAKALDGDTGTYWNVIDTGQNHNNWYIVLDIAAPQTLTRVAVNSYGDTTHDIAAFKLQSSQVGSPYSWEDVVSVDNVQGGTDQRQVFGGFQGTARYWRFVVTRTHGGWQPYLIELNLFSISPASGK
ncbi:PREDICTED: tropomyosin-1-like [Branchiostoma belcheri]|uniref:Tropomyosin-1-like n=1 Tax=Branchiostoma belcheri TaxID=7741 RepID=A0A6P4YSA1_BRABE|nr:PREDICTED: tropomyosin-1-like [Branchiostoma belcheri]